MREAPGKNPQKCGILNLILAFLWVGKHENWISFRNKPLKNTIEAFSHISVYLMSTIIRPCPRPVDWGIINENREEKRGVHGWQPDYSQTTVELFNGKTKTITNYPMFFNGKQRLIPRQNSIWSMLYIYLNTGGDDWC